jgi:hypothetical protein
VISIYRFAADGQPMVQLGDIQVSTNHFVRYNNRWIPSIDHPDAVLCGEWDGGKARPLVCLDTDTHEIPLGNYIFSDWDETSSSDTATMKLSEEKLNSEKMSELSYDWLYQPSMDGLTTIRTKYAFKPAVRVELGDELETGKVVGIGRRFVTSWVNLPSGEIVTPSTLIWTGNVWKRAGHVYSDCIVNNKKGREMITLVVFKTACIETIYGTVMRDMCEIHSPDMEEPTACALDPELSAH